MYSKKAELKNKTDLESKKELENIEKEMVNKYAEENLKKIQTELKGMSCEDGGWNPGYLWRLKTKISPRPIDPPTAMESSDGILLTDQKEIQSEALRYYKNLFEDLPMDGDHVDIQIAQEKMCKMRLEQCSENKTDPWILEDLELVLKGLKKGTSRDPYGYTNELFKNEVAGKDLKLATLKLMNKIKDQQTIPKSLQLCNITSIYKSKGPRNKFNSYRGIFRVTVLRNILDRLIYNDLYQTIDSNLSDCNVGNRKGRNIRDNLFVLNAALNSTKKKNEEPLDIAVYDVRKCFDTMWAKEAVNDLYD